MIHAKLKHSASSALRTDQVEWEWKRPEQKAFEQCKELLTSDKVLVHYDPDLHLTLACDSSAYGIGAVIQHEIPSGKTLAPAEKNYSQIEKEGLSFILGVKKFHQYLWRRKFKLVTDHKPLLTLFGEHKCHYGCSSNSKMGNYTVCL